jgi:lysophospholipase L1-like esterase
MRMHGMFRAARAATVALTLVVAMSRGALADKLTYLSIGDSVAFGETNFSNDPSYGNRGYVSLYANYIAGQNGGVLPKVDNLAIDGETSSSFFIGSGRVPPGNTMTDNQLAALNMHYGTGPQPPQNGMMLATIAAEKAAGQTISNVTISLGSNDLFALATKPGFLTESASQQQADLAHTLGMVQSNYVALLTQLKAFLPDAKISVLGTYNPFPAAPNSPFAPFAAPAIAALNQILAGEAKAFGVNYVDTASAFAGKESALTYITQGGNVHPNDAGYQAIASQIEAVPEPSTLIMFGAGAVALVALRRQRRSKTA